MQQLSDIKKLDVRAVGGPITQYAECGTEAVGRIQYLIFSKDGRSVTIGWCRSGVPGGRSTTLLVGDGWGVEVSADQRTLVFKKEAGKDRDSCPVRNILPIADGYTIELREV